MRRAAALACALLLIECPGLARAQAIDLSHGGPVNVTAAGGIDWDQRNQTVTAHGDARAVRGTVTVTADQLIAYYRKKSGAARGAGNASAAPGGSSSVAQPGLTPAAAATPAAPSGAAQSAPASGNLAAGSAGAPAGAPGAAAPGADDTSGNEIYRLEAVGHVHIFTPTDQAWGDHAVYDIDQAVMVLTGRGLKLITPQDTMTARDAMEYWSQKHMSVGRGDAIVISKDGRRVRGDVLVGYSDPGTPGAAGKASAIPPTAPPAKPGADPLTQSGKLKRVEAFGHVEVRTATEIVTGDRGVYVPDTGLARIVGHVHVTRGENQLNGAAAIVNMKTGIATMTEAPGARVQGLVVPAGSDQDSGAGKPSGTSASSSKKGNR